MDRNALAKSVSGLTLLLVILPWAGPAPGEVAHFQNGVSPNKDYAGCADTKISIYNEGESREGREGKSPALRTFDKARRILVKFDLSSLPKDAAVAKALLRVYCVQPTLLSTQMSAGPLTHEWDETATGMEYKKTDDEKTPEGDWTKRGGDYDEQKVVTVPVSGGPFGHGFEFDLTDVVADWLSGKRPNHGVILISSQHTEHVIASSEWQAPAYRPELLVEYAPAGQQATGQLKPWPARPKQVTSSPAAATPDKDPSYKDPTGPVRLGLTDEKYNTPGLADAYIKTLPKLAGQWGWMPMLRVGGGVGNFNAALLSYDLGMLSTAKAIPSAKLRVYVVNGSAGVRFGAYLAKDEAFAFDAATVCLDGPKAGGAWPAGGYRAAFEDAPVAYATITTPAKDAADQRACIEWDLTGAVRARAGKTLNLLLGHDLEGGMLDLYSSKYDDPALRPVLEVVVGPAVRQPAAVAAAPPTTMPMPKGEYWVEPMKEAHKRFKGDVGTLGQYGDSITVTRAFLAPYSYGQSSVPEKCPDNVKSRLALVDEYTKAHNTRRLWNQWKDSKYGSQGQMTVAWAFANVDAWQKLCKPEVTVILFGTNDASGGLVPPDHTEMMAGVIDRCLADGTVPILTTLPPNGSQKANPSLYRNVQAIRTAQIALARVKKVPLIDLYTEIVSRQPEDWDKTLMGDALHPSFPKAFQQDFTEEGLKQSGYTLRSYLTLLTYADIIEKVLK